MTENCLCWKLKKKMSDWRKIMYKWIYDRMVEEYEKEEKIDLIHKSCPIAI